MSKNLNVRHNFLCTRFAQMQTQSCFVVCLNPVSSPFRMNYCLIIYKVWLEVETKKITKTTQSKNEMKKHSDLEQSYENQLTKRTKVMTWAALKKTHKIRLKLS